jgi:hypothetical protein
MAYVSNQLNCISQGVGGAPKVWLMFGTDVHTDVDAANWISDGSEKGLKENDVVLYVRTGDTSPGATLHSVDSVTAGGAASLTAAILA